MALSMDPTIGLEESVVEGETLETLNAGLNIRKFGQNLIGVNVDRRAVNILLEIRNRQPPVVR